MKRSEMGSKAFIEICGRCTDLSGLISLTHESFVNPPPQSSQAEFRTAWDGSWVGGLRIGSENVVCECVVRS
jgi:hypothetical protein